MKRSIPLKTHDIVYVSMFVSLLIILSQLQLPLIGGIPITLQTLGVFIIANLLGPKLGVISICIYLLLGSFGIPVFSSFRSGLGHLLGPTGGFLIGFIPMVFISSLGFRKKLYVAYIYHIIGLVVCYFMGCVMYFKVYQIFFFPTVHIMFIKDMVIALLALFLSKEFSLRINLLEHRND